MKIKLYDMNNYPSNKAFFPDDTFLSELDIVPVALSLPYGEVRISNIAVATMDKITHFSFSMSEKTWIVEVKQKTIAGENLYLLEYEVDYLKTFFENVSGKEYLVIKRTDRLGIALLREYDSDIPLSSNIIYDSIQEYDFNLDTDIIVVTSDSHIPFNSKTGVSVFLLGDETHTPQSSLGALWGALMTSDIISTAIGKSKGDTILSQILGVYVVPKIPTSLYSEEGLLTYTTNDSIGHHNQALIDGCYGRYLIADNSLSIQTIDTGITYDVSRWENLPPVSHLYMYHPFIGTIDVPLQHLQDSEDTIKFKYIIDYITGTMTVYTIDMSNSITNVPLPKIPLSTIEKSDITQILNNPYKSAIELVTMGKMEDTPITLVEGSGYNALLYKKIYTQKVYRKLLLNSMYRDIGSLSYTRCSINAIIMYPGYRYWCLETCLDFLKGPKWYVDKLKQALIEGFEY